MRSGRYGAAIILLSSLLVCVNAPAQDKTSTLRHALNGTGSAAVLLDVASGRVLASYGAVDRPATPGSTLKPLVLETALTAGTVRDSETVHCTGHLSIRGHNLACTHPREITVLDARQALADSCNTYFAMLAQRMSSSALQQGLRGYGLQLSSPATPEDRALLALGLQGVQVTPLQLGNAYRSLALQMQQKPQGASAVVMDGLLQSVRTGMAHDAAVEGLTLAGKTGTALNTSNPRDHGWFAGILYSGEDARTPLQVLVIYLPVGNGGDAARLARSFLLEYRRGRR